MKNFTDLLKEKIIVFDGATGTSLQTQNLTADDFGGEALNGCNEYLVFSKPDAVRKVHEGFLSVGCDVIETDTFGGTSIVLAEYGLADRAYEMNVAAARIAKEMAQAYSTAAQPRFVAGSIGPTTKLPSLGHISFRDMEASFYEQVRGLVDGGADLLCIETSQDILQAKAALAGAFRYFAEIRRRIPIIASVTVETMGTMLLGTDISAALTSLEPYDIDVLGMNCATGPKEMSENVRYLCANSPKPIFIMPNAGIPENVGGHAHYKLTPDEMARYMSHFVNDLGVSVVGGCCGTTPAHIKALVDAVGGRSPINRKWEFTPGGSSLYQAMPFRINPGPIMVGERTNANGSKLFREMLGREEWEGMVAMGREQAKEGAHFLDVCTAYVGRDEVRDMQELIYRYNTQITLPLVIDSTEAPVLEEALERIAGRAVVNSINLEDGEERTSKVLPLCKKFGAAVIALTIDESGMAKTAEAKFRIAERIYNIAVGKYGMRPQDLIFDTLTFTLGSGDEEFRKAGIETIEAIRLIKQKFPEVQTILGVSNISFGLSPHIRHVLNSVFLHFAIEAGLDMAIVHASKIMPLFKIPEQERELCRQLIFDERRDGYDPLQELLSVAAAQKGVPVVSSVTAAATVEERLKRRIIDGDKVGLQADLDEGLKAHPPLTIINEFLLDGMKVVGDLFGSGQMQLPFVLQSAEVMKSAVAYLEQFMDKADSTTKGTMVIATVKGDVHDIGKNLVDIILTNNGYTVVNLGIKCSLETMLTAVKEHQADALGMSGLLVKSTLIMKENLQEMNQQGLNLPVVLGGAALTRRYVEEDLRSIYRGALAYAGDAFDGLHFMEEVVARKHSGAEAGIATVDAALKEMEKVHASTLNFLGRLSEEQFATPGVQGSWSVKDIVAHLSAWEGNVTERLKDYLAGRTETVVDCSGSRADELNKVYVAERAGMNRVEVMKEWQANRAVLVDVVRSLSEEQYRMPVNDTTIKGLIAANTYDHQRHHMAKIREWLARPSAEDVADSAVGFEAKTANAGTAGTVSPVTNIPLPPFYGSVTVDHIPLDEMYPYINQTALFRGQWQFKKGKLSDQEYQKIVDEKVLPVFERLKKQSKKEGLLCPAVVYGYFPAQSKGNDLIVYKPKGTANPIGRWNLVPSSDEGMMKEQLEEWVRFTFPRQRGDKHLCLADYFAPVGSGKMDVAAFDLVTVGALATEHAAKLLAENNYQEYLYFHGLSVESAEGLAEYWHRKMREEMGIIESDPTGTDGKPDIRKFFSQQYRGARFSFGYPACPNLEDHKQLFQLLQPERIGIQLTEEWQLVPEQSTDAIIIHHPDARYFGV